MYCEVENNIIVNVVEVPSAKVAHELGLFELPEDKWIGDSYEDLPEPEPTLEDRVTALEESSTDDSAIWDELARAYMEGVNEA